MNLFSQSVKQFGQECVAGRDEFICPGPDFLKGLDGFSVSFGRAENLYEFFQIFRRQLGQNLEADHPVEKGQKSPWYRA